MSTAVSLGVRVSASAPIEDEVRSYGTNLRKAFEHGKLWLTLLAGKSVTHSHISSAEIVTGTDFATISLSMDGNFRVFTLKFVSFVKR